MKKHFELLKKQQQAHTPVNLNTKPEHAGEVEEGDDDDEDEEGESEERKEETPTYSEILTPAQLAQRQMIQDSLQMFQSSLAMRGQAEVGFENQCGPLSLVEVQRGSALIGRERCWRQQSYAIKNQLVAAKVGAMERKKKLLQVFLLAP